MLQEVHTELDNFSGDLSCNSMPALRAAFCLVPQEPSARSQETRAEILKVLDKVP